MATIIFKVVGTPGHYKATYKLAQKLKRKMHRVIYIGEQGFKVGIMKQGFEFYNSAIFRTAEQPPEENVITKILFIFRNNDKIKKLFLKRFYSMRLLNC